MKGLFPAAALTVLVVGSSAEQTAVPPSKTTADRLKALEEQVEVLSNWITTVSSYTGDRSTVLDCDSGKFSAIMPASNTLQFLVSCESITPYLEGFRIQLKVGNPFSMQFGGIKGELGYGETLPKTFGQHAAFSTVEPLLPGVWNSIQVTLNPAAAKDVRVIRLYDFSFQTARPR